MKRLLAVLAVLVAAVPAAAEVRSERVCQSKTLTQNTTTDCTITDISAFRYFSFQVYCVGDGSMSVDVDWIGGSAAGSAYMGIPLLSSGSAMGQLKTAYATESAWSVVQSVTPPVTPVATLRFTENNNESGVVCSAIINMGD